MVASDKLNGVSHILFDAVGTLIQPVPAAPDVYWAVATRHGFSVSESEIRERFVTAFGKYHVPGPTDEATEQERWRLFVADIFRGSPSTDGMFQELWSHFARAEAWQVYEDVVPTLTELAGRGFNLAIASNFDRRLLDIWAVLKPLQLATRVFCSSEVGYAKPSREFFTTIQRELAVEPHQILFVGDDPVKDYAGALQCGWRALLINRRSGETPAAGSINRLTELLAL